MAGAMSDGLDANSERIMNAVLTNSYEDIEITSNDRIAKHIITFGILITIVFVYGAICSNWCGINDMISAYGIFAKLIIEFIIYYIASYIMCTILLVLYVIYKNSYK
ncbi:MAG: hypothetical protein WC346_15560 [Methanogenium sp.]|jgi:hypothetical protein